jgi:hypothetical protein
MPKFRVYVLPAEASSHRAFDEFVATLPVRSNTPVITQVEVYPADAVQQNLERLRPSGTLNFRLCNIEFTGLIICMVMFQHRSHRAWQAFRDHEELQFHERHCGITPTRLGINAVLQRFEHEMTQRYNAERRILTQRSQQAAAQRRASEPVAVTPLNWTPAHGPRPETNDPEDIRLMDEVERLWRETDRRRERDIAEVLPRPVAVAIDDDDDDTAFRFPTDTVTFANGLTVSIEEARHYRPSGERITNADGEETGIQRVPVQFDDLFGSTPRRPRPNRNGRIYDNASPVNSQGSWAEHRELQRRFGNMVTPAQQRAATERRLAAEEAANRYKLMRFDNATVWLCPGPNGEMLQYPIVTMEDEHLWETINWLVRNEQPLFDAFAASLFPNVPPAVACKQWFRSLPVLRGMIQEAAKRQMRFPKDVYNYLKVHVFGYYRTASPVGELRPWEDPADRHQLEALTEFCNEPVVVDPPVDPVATYGRDFRQIDI